MVTQNICIPRKQTLKSLGGKEGDREAEAERERDRNTQRQRDKRQTDTEAETHEQRQTEKETEVQRSRERLRGGEAGVEWQSGRVPWVRGVQMHLVKFLFLKLICGFEIISPKAKLFFKR